MTMNNSEIQYWDNYYGKGLSTLKQSDFAEFSLNYMDSNKTIIDIGCGNGRDSLFFAKNNLHVTGIDSSKQAISELKKIQQVTNSSITAVESSFIEFLENKTFDYIYSRFTLHAISENNESILLKNAYSSLSKNGCFFIEARSVKDDIFGLGKCVERNAYIYNDHYRRFIVFDEITESLVKEGFEIIYSKEDKGFAVYQNEDPVCVRIIAKKP